MNKTQMQFQNWIQTQMILWYDKIWQMGVKYKQKINKKVENSGMS